MIDLKSSGSSDSHQLNACSNESENLIVSQLYEAADKGDLLEYMYFFRGVSLHNGPQSITAEVLLEHLIIIYNCFDPKLLDYADIESHLRRLILQSNEKSARDEGEQPISLDPKFEAIIEIYFFCIGSLIYGTAGSRSRYENFSRSLADSHRSMAYALGTSKYVPQNRDRLKSGPFHSFFNWIFDRLYA